MSDLELVQKVRVLDDRAAYSQLVRRHQVAIRTYLVRLTHNLETADDLAQETFLHGYRRIEQLKDGARFRAWIYTIAHTQFLQWARAQKPMSSEVPEGRDATFLDGTATARIEVEALLKSLRPEERSAVVLCLAHDFSHAEAASILGIPIGTVKSLILRARQKIDLSRVAGDYHG